MNLFSAIRARPTRLAQDAPATELIVPKSWFAVVEEATGILYFTWNDFKTVPAKLDAARKAFTELGSPLSLEVRQHLVTPGCGQSSSVS